MTTRIVPRSEMRRETVDLGAVAEGQQVMLAALKEVGIDTTAANATSLHLELNYDPKLCWRAANIAREAIGLDEWPWEEWCQWHRSNGPKSTAWLNHWGAP